MTRQGRLPVVFPPEADERLSSWLTRMAAFYAMTVPEFVAELGMSERNVFDLEWRLSEGEGALIAARTGVSEVALQAMTFQEITPDGRIMIARKTRHHCPSCPADVHRKAASFPWMFQCPIHSIDFRDVGSAILPDILGSAHLAALQSHAKTGVAVLDSWARGEEQGAFGPVEMLLFLTTRHRRASPPNVSEQPRMSLGARRDYHAFLTTPIIRQALTVVVPEYDRVAPVLTKPVRAGLHSLVQGSLLQAFALTVGIGRIVEDPVNRAIDVLLASDVDGQGRMQDVLRSWPLSLRRQISARFWRAQRDEREREIAEKTTRRRQSHKLRAVQSHKCRYRIS